MDQKIKILIVEDEAIIAESIRLSLDDLGYEVTGTCYKYDEALQAISKDEADIILLDINLGTSSEKNGLELASLISSTTKKPFIFLTAYNDLDTIKQATKLQPSGYLIKPANTATLFAAIQTSIENFSGLEKTTTVTDNFTQPDYFFVKVGSRTHKVLWEEIYCLEAGKNYVKLRSSISRLDYPIRGSLTYVLTSLLPRRLDKEFIRINRAVALNRRFITSYDADFVYCGSEKYENGKIGMKELLEILIL